MVVSILLAHNKHFIPDTYVIKYTHKSKWMATSFSGSMKSAITWHCDSDMKLYTTWILKWLVNLPVSHCRKCGVNWFGYIAIVQFFCFIVMGRKGQYTLQHQKAMKQWEFGKEQKGVRNLWLEGQKF